jgi:hypothetical protein
MVDEAKLHLESASRIAGSDPNGAYHLLYDAARKAVWAHMLANGYRPTSAPGAHAAATMYAVEALADEPSIVHFDRMRRSRNRSEYGTAHFSKRVVDTDLAHARAIVAAAGAALAPRR